MDKIKLLFYFAISFFIVYLGGNFIFNSSNTLRLINESYSQLKSKFSKSNSPSQSKKKQSSELFKKIAFWRQFKRERLNVLDCSDSFMRGWDSKYIDYIAYNTKNGERYIYNSFKETYEPQKKSYYESDSFSGGMLGWSGYESIDVKNESIFVGNNLKIRESKSGDASFNLYQHKVDASKVITIFDANDTAKSTFNGTYKFEDNSGNKYINESKNISCKLSNYYKFPVVNAAPPPAADIIVVPVPHTFGL